MLTCFGFLVHCQLCGSDWATDCRVVDSEGGGKVCLCAVVCGDGSVDRDGIYGWGEGGEEWVGVEG